MHSWGDPRTHLMHHAGKWTNLSGISDIKLNEFEGTKQLQVTAFFPCLSSKNLRENISPETMQ